MNKKISILITAILLTNIIVMFPFVSAEESTKDSGALNENTSQVVSRLNSFYEICAQSFKPSFNTLTKIEIYITKSEGIEPDVLKQLSLTIREDKDSAYLVRGRYVVTLLPDNIGWFSLDLGDSPLFVEPGKKYYLTASLTKDLPNNKEIRIWGEYSSGEGPYSGGTLYYNKEGTAGEWEEVTDGDLKADLGFRVFGFNHQSATFYVDDDAPSDGDGSQEQPFQNINDALDVAEDRDTIVVFSGTYNEKIILDKEVRLIGSEINDQGLPTIKKERLNNENSFLTIESNNCLVDSFNIEAVEQYGNNYGIKIDSNENTIKNCKIMGTYFGIKLSDRSNNKITNNIIKKITKAIVISNGENIVFSDNVVKKINNRVGQCGLQIDSSEDCEITNNDFYGHGITFSGNLKKHYTTHTINNNEVDGKKLVYHSGKNSKKVSGNVGQVILADCSQCEVSGLDIVGIHKPISIYYSDNCIVSNNELKGVVYGTGIYIYGSSDLKVLNNEITEYLFYALEIVKSNDNKIRTNRIADSTSGISLFESNNNKIQDQNVILKSDTGVELISSDENKVFKNEINNCNYGVGIRNSDGNTVNENLLTIDEYYDSDLDSYGVYVYGEDEDCFGNTIYKNDIYNFDIGIYLENSRESIVRLNQIWHNDVGVQLENSYDNRIFYNNFLYNEDNAFGCNQNNFWDDGLEKGNYWDDYISKNPDAKDSNSDGIWDYSYQIYGGGQDNFPSTNKIITAKSKQVEKHSILDLIKSVLSRLNFFDIIKQLFSRINPFLNSFITNYRIMLLI